ncbi:MAG: helix-turn-helix domain-containing protein [Planctomycetota bacterium]|jgi:transcriptional regulator with XRE-family HTH domain
MQKKRKILPRDKEFGQRLRKLRKGQGLSQTKLAQKLGYKTSVSVSKIESGITPPDVRVLAKIAKLLSADLHWLITGRPSPRFSEFIDLLKPYVETYITQLSEKIRSLECEAAGLEIAHIFRGEDNRLDAQKNHQKTERLRVEYQKLVSIINQANAPK